MVTPSGIHSFALFLWVDVSDYPPLPSTAPQLLCCRLLVIAAAGCFCYYQLLPSTGGPLRWRRLICHARLSLVNLVPPRLHPRLPLSAHRTATPLRRHNRLHTSHVTNEIDGKLITMVGQPAGRLPSTAIRSSTQRTICRTINEGRMMNVACTVAAFLLLLSECPSTSRADLHATLTVSEHSI